MSPAIGGELTSIAAGAALPAAFDGSATAWFGEAASGTYCTGYALVDQHPSDGCRSSAPMTGDLTSPSFAVTSAPATVRFHAWWEIAGGDFETADLMTVEYSADGGAHWTTAARLNPSGPPFGSLHQPYTAGGLRAPGVWREYSADLTPALGSADVRVRFRFDSVDDLGQGFRGLLIDGIRVEGSEMPPAAAAPSTRPPPGQPDQAPGPAGGAVLGQALVIEPVSGRTAYVLPGRREAVRLLSRTVVPVATIVDARNGTVRVTAEGANGASQTGTFHDASFQIRQEPGDPVVEFALRGGRFPHCGQGCTSARRRATVRRLWGDATGRFRIRGRYASATVRGTNWVVEDHPGDTAVTVRRGSTLVRDFVRDRDVILNEGETYVARVIYVNRQPGNPRFGQRYTLRIRRGRVVHVYLNERVTLQ